MKVTIQIDSDQDVNEFNIVMDSSINYRALCRISHEIRQILKYQEEKSDDLELTLRNLQLLIPEGIIV